MRILLFLIGLFPSRAYAQNVWDLWDTPCSPLQPGCGSGPANVFANTLPNLAIFMLQMTTALTVFFIVWAGVQLVLSFGDDAKISKHKSGIFYALLGLFTAIGSQLLVSFLVTQNLGQNATGVLPIAVAAGVIGSLLTILNGLFVVAIVYYGIRMLMASGDTGSFTSARTAVTWAVLGAIVVNLANALVQGITSFFAL